MQANSEGVELLVPPDYPTEMPRTALSLRHHTAFKQHNVLNAVCVKGLDRVITSSVLDENTTSIGGYISMWDVPTAEERACGIQFLATLMKRFETDFPHEHLVYSPREEMLFSGSQHSGCILCTRITNIHKKAAASQRPNEQDGGADIDPTVINLSPAPVFDMNTADEKVLPELPLRSDPKILKDLLNLKVKMKRRQIEQLAIEEKRKLERQDQVLLAVSNTKSMPSKKSDLSPPPQSPTQKIRFNSTAGISAIQEIKSTDGSNFLVVGSHDGTVALMDLSKPYMEVDQPEKFITRRITAHEGGVKLIEFSPIFDAIFTAGVASSDSNSTVLVWETHTVHGMGMSDKARLKSNSDSQIASVNIADEEANAITVDESCNVNIYSMYTFEKIQTILPPSNFTGIVTGSAYIPPRPSQK